MKKTRLYEYKYSALVFNLPVLLCVLFWVAGGVDNPSKSAEVELFNCKLKNIFQIQEGITVYQ